MSILAYWRVEMKCDQCKGKGYIEQNYKNGSLLVPVKEWCEACKGTGRIKYEGDRTGIEWERE